MDERELADFIKMSHRDDVHKVGGKIAWGARRDDMQPLLATGTSAIAAAIRAISEARRYVGADREPLEILTQPAFRDEAMKQALAFYPVRTSERKLDYMESSAQFTVSKTSKAAVLAGAIAGRARQGVGAILTAIGDDAVCVAAVAAAKARIYLEQDRLDIRFVVWEESIDKQGRDGRDVRLTATRFRFYVESF